MPDAAFCNDPAERAWLSACVEDVAHWSPAFAGRIANVDEAGAMLALDVWVLNEARHSRNILAEGPRGGDVRLWAIDADEATVGHIDDYRARLEECPRPTTTRGACPSPCSLRWPGAQRSERRLSRPTAFATAPWPPVPSPGNPERTSSL